MFAAVILSAAKPILPVAGVAAALYKVVVVYDAQVL
jgi:hypothetical protein